MLNLHVYVYTEGGARIELIKLRVFIGRSQAADATVAERGALYEGAVQTDERLGRVVGAIKVCL